MYCVATQGVWLTELWTMDVVSIERLIGRKTNIRSLQVQFATGSISLEELGESLALEAELALRDALRRLAKQIARRTDLSLADIQNITGLDYPACRQVVMDARHPGAGRHIRHKVLKRDGGFCQRCGSVRNLRVDHIIPRSVGGLNTLSNLWVLCNGCNAIKARTWDAAIERLVAARSL